MSVLKNPFTLLIFALLGAGVFFGVQDFKTPTQPAKIPATYASSASCKKCHVAEFEKWQCSHHGLAERAVSKEEDYSAFSPKQTFGDGGEAFVDAEGLAKILAQGSETAPRAYPVLRVIGNKPLRQFLIPAPGGRLQACNIALDPAKNEWFDIFAAGDARAPGDWGHWTGQGMNWNSMCAACHNTRVQKNYEPRSNSYHTTMAEMSVSCEACHGPLKGHVEWQEKSPAGHQTDPTLPVFTRDQAMETCAACHSRRTEISGDLVPGESFDDHFSLAVTDETDTFYPDGQTRDENYEFSSFLSSRMQHAGVRCVDCHDSHSGKLIATGNQLCMNCHAGGRAEFLTAPVIDPVSHSHHGAESTGNQCVACHMPTTTYMQRHPRHDHSFSIPDPKLTQEAGVPNACNKCHTDKDTDWAIVSHRNFYGEKPDRASRTRALLVASARRGEPAARGGLVQLLATEPIPAWQASACHLLARWSADPEVTQALIAKLTSTSPLVREAAVRSLADATAEKTTTLRPLLDDPSRSVRVAAAWVLLEQLDLQSRAGKELVHMLDLHADQPTGRMQLAQFSLRRGDSVAAIRQMRKAIEWDPNAPSFHHDLAVLLSTTGDAPGAVDALRKASQLEPGNPDYHLSLALALSDIGATQDAITELETTVQLDPQQARAWYNLGLARSAMNQPLKAITALHKAESADPTDAAIPYARATVHARLGQKDEAFTAASRALQLRPDFPEARKFQEMLTR
jgi:tetratricopeptide (TPR) repeat protein